MALRKVAARRVGSIIEDAASAADSHVRRAASAARAVAGRDVDPAERRLVAGARKTDVAVLPPLTHTHRGTTRPAHVMQKKKEKKEREGKT